MNNFLVGLILTLKFRPRLSLLFFLKIFGKAVLNYLNA